MPVLRRGAPVSLGARLALMLLVVLVTTQVGAGVAVWLVRADALTEFAAAVVAGMVAGLGTVVLMFDWVQRGRR